MLGICLSSSTAQQQTYRRETEGTLPLPQGSLTTTLVQTAAVNVRTTLNQISE